MRRTRLRLRRAVFLISPETIALVRERTDILAVVQEAVPSLKRRGRSFVGLCPFHKEKTPSFHVNPDRGFFHCFGCKEAGSAIDFLIKHEGYTFPEAVRALAERAGIEVEETRQDAAVHGVRSPEEGARRPLCGQCARSDVLRGSASPSRAPRVRARRAREARSRCPGKGPEAVGRRSLQAFRIGYAPPGWDGLTSFLRAQGVSPAAAETVGLLVPRSSGSGYYDRFRHRLMFAVMDAQGRVVAFSGRALRDLPDAPQRGKANPVGAVPCAAPKSDAGLRRSTSTRPRARSTRRARCSSASTRRATRSAKRRSPFSSRATSTSCRSTRAGSRTSSRRSAPRSPPSRRSS